MPRHIIIIVLSLLVVVPRCLADSDPLPQSIAPFINDDTFLVIDFDLARIDVADGTKHWLEPLATGTFEQKIVTAVFNPFDAWAKRLRADGATHCYVISTTGLLPSPEFVGSRNPYFVTGIISNSTFAVIPGASMRSLEEMNKDLHANAKETWPGNRVDFYPACRPIHGAAVIGMGTLLDSMKSITPSPRPQFEIALAAAGNQPMRVALVPPPVFARAVNEILLDPAGFGDKPAGPIVSRGFRWLALGVEPNIEKFNAQLIIQSADAAAAKAFADSIKDESNSLIKVLGSRNPAPDPIVRKKGDTSKAPPTPDFASVAFNALQLFSFLPEAKGDQLVLSIDGQRAALIRTFLQMASLQSAGVAARRESLNHLKEIGLAMHNYNDAHKQFPDHAIRDKNGKPLLSWRVALLPYLDNGLYKEFHLDEPWDSDHNRKLIERMPAVYRSPDSLQLPAGRTRYLVPVGENLIFPPTGGVKLKDITDGTSKTIMTVEVDPDHAVIWTKPDDLEVDLENPGRGLFALNQPAAVGFADGSVRTIRSDVTPKALRAALTRNGGEIVDGSEF